MCAKRSAKVTPEPPEPDGWDQDLYEALKKAASVDGLRKVSEQVWYRLSLLRSGGIALQIAKARKGRDFKLAEELLRVLDGQLEQHEDCLVYLGSREFDNAVVKRYAEDLLRWCEEHGTTEEPDFPSCPNPAEILPFAHFIRALAIPPDRFDAQLTRYIEDHVRPHVEEIPRCGGRPQYWWKLVRRNMIVKKEDPTAKDRDSVRAYRKCDSKDLKEKNKERRAEGKSDYTDEELVKRLQQARSDQRRRKRRKS